MTTERAVRILFQHHFDIFIVRSLTRDQRYDVEREQALKLIRSLVDIPGTVDLIPQSVIRIVIAIAEQSEEKFRNICIETICELGNPYIYIYIIIIFFCLLSSFFFLNLILMCIQNKSLFFLF